MGIDLVSGIAGGVLGGIGSLYGSYKAGQERKRMEQYLNQQDAENKAWYNANALSDFTQRADTQNLIRNLREQLDRRNQITNNTAVVTGATPEQVAAQKEQSNQVVSDVYSNIGAQGQQYKDLITNRYLAMKNNLANQRMGMMEGAANSYESLMSNATGLLGDSFKSLGQYQYYKPASQQTTTQQATPSNINQKIPVTHITGVSVPQLTFPEHLKNPSA